jgi:hypothetical protein
MWSILVCEPCDPSSLQLLDILGTFVPPVAHWDGEMGEPAVVFFVTLQDRVEDFLVPTNPLLQVFDMLFVAAPLLSVICVALL